MAFSILVVDDDPGVREVLSDNLREIFPGAMVCEATNGAEAIQKLGKQKFDLLLTDQCMPRRTGVQLIEHIQKLPKDQQPGAIVVVTGNVSAADIQQQFGFAFYLPKPFSRELLKEVTTKATSKQRLPAFKFDVEFVNFFIESTLSALKSTASIEGKKVRVFLKGDQSGACDIRATIELESDQMQGRFAMLFEHGLFQNPQGSGTKEESVAHAITAATSICQRVFNATTEKLKKSGHQLRAATPVVRAVNGPEVRNPNSEPCISVEFSTAQGNFFFEASLVAKKAA